MSTVQEQLVYLITHEMHANLLEKGSMVCLGKSVVFVSPLFNYLRTKTLITRSLAFRHFATRHKTNSQD
jgi:hypothetical protein